MTTILIIVAVTVAASIFLGVLFALLVAGGRCDDLDGRPRG